jgi:hypothetical protein
MTEDILDPPNYGYFSLILEDSLVPVDYAYFPVTVSHLRCQVLRHMIP